MRTNSFYVDTFDSPIGTLTTSATETELVMIALPNYSREEVVATLQRRFRSLTIQRGNPVNRIAREQLTAFLKGNRREFQLPFTLKGCTAFEQSILAEVAAIPYGRTRTYGEIAQRCGVPLAFRAVGAANARNPLPLLIPCHRVVATRGLGGYGGGLPLKKKLLALEQAHSLTSTLIWNPKEE